MAQLLSPLPSRQERISQLLPTVKCSNCNNEVSLDELGDHICPRIPPMPLLPKPATSPTSATALLPTRLQNRVPAPPRSRGQPATSPSFPSNRDVPPRRDNDSRSALSPRRVADRRPSPLSSVQTRSPSNNWHQTNPRSDTQVTQRDPSPQSPRHPVTVRPPEQEPDTKSGGEAGMAGVGRRGFAAAARAAMFATVTLDTVTSMDSTSATSGRNEGRGTPKLVINSALRPSSRGATTPSLSSGNSSNSFSPPFPQSPSDIRDIISPASSERPSFFEKYKNDAPEFTTPSYAKNTTQNTNDGHYKGDDTRLPSSPISSSSEYADTPGPVPTAFYNQNEPLELSSGSEYGGLAYADSTATDSEDEVEKKPVRSVPSIIRTPKSSFDGSAKATTSQIRFPSENRKDKDTTARKKSTGGSSSGRSPHHGRTASAATSSSNYSHNTALNQATNTYFEDDVTSSRSRSMSRPPISPFQSNKPKLQTPLSVPSPSKPVPNSSSSRSAQPTTENDRADRKKRKVKVCVRCEKRIENGKWVQMDGGKVLCERCWKNMYLPKCRRCNLPIEKAAVSSSDGQLKGKYHKDCFNCNTCHEPFPDKSFYVFDGKPLCAYHYHEANDSLCSAATCGQPIEGPCAVSHVGDRYHPEHMLCEHPGYPQCREKLSGDYYEVDGRMLCERHANSGRHNEGSDSWKAAKAMKRTTRMITLGRNGLR